MTDQPRIRSYAAFGLRVASHLAIPELPSLPDDDAPFDVEILLGSVDPALAGGVTVDERIQLASDSARVGVENTAAFHLWRGRRITIDVDPGATPDAVRFFLLGVVFGVLLVQRGLVALHCSGVAWHGFAVAFMGPSGIGKSTLAAAMQIHGCPVFFDVRASLGDGFYLEGIESVFTAAEYPFRNASNRMWWEACLRQAAAQGTRVVMTGNGGNIPQY